jgi:branched-chain amino acid transport system substrate-binding protein
MRNRMVKEKTLGAVVLAIALTALFVLTACAPQPIVEEKTVQFGWVLPITGGASAAIAPVVTGGQDYVRYFNEQEAIPGVQIELLWRDTAFQFSLGLSHYERLVAAGIPLIGAVDSALVLGLKERFELDKVVAFIPGATYQEELYPEPGWLYAVTPLISEQAAVLFQYFMETWQEERPPRLALVGISESQFGWEPRYATGYARDLGFEVLPWEAVPIVPLDTTVQLLRLSEEGADLVHLQCQAEGAGVILKDAERLGLLDKFQFAGHSSAMGDRTIRLAGAAATEGFLTSMVYPWFDETEVPGIKLIIDNMMKYHGKVERDGEYYFGWVSAAVICEAISRAIENVGYENLDGPAIKEALDGMNEFDVYGLANITYKPDDHRGATRMAVYEVRGGKLVRVSDWQEVPFGRDWKYE